MGVSGAAVPLATTNHVQINNYITSSVNVTDPVSVVLINAENVRVTVVVLAR